MISKFFALLACLFSGAELIELAVHAPETPPRHPAMLLMPAVIFLAIAIFFGP